MAQSLSLPFFDDFSYATESSVPNESLWENSNNVYINHEFSDNSPTIGVATFDEMDINGNAVSYPSADGVMMESVSGTDISIFDILTSKPINLEENNEGEIYLSFFIQPRGRWQILNQPGPNRDELHLEFKKCIEGNCEWVKVAIFTLHFSDDDYLYDYEVSLSAMLNGTPFALQIYDFYYYSVLIDETYFLQEDFQFRIFNASDDRVYNEDPWHIDYVLIDSYLSPPSEANIGKLAFAKPPSNLSYPYTPTPYPYSIMPWDEFINNVSDYWTPEWEVKITNSSNVNKKIRDPRIEIQASGEQIYHDNFADVGNQIVSANSVNTYNININQNNIDFPLDNPLNLSANFSFQDNQEENINKVSKKIMSFNDILAYDDGTGEAILGINESVRIATKFSIINEGKLYGIQMKLPEDFPFSNNVKLQVEIFKGVLDSSPELIQRVSLARNTEDFLTIPFTALNDDELVIRSVDIGGDNKDFFIALSYNLETGNCSTQESSPQIENFGSPWCGGILMWDNSKHIANNNFFASTSTYNWTEGGGLHISPNSSILEELLFLKSYTPMVRAVLSEDIILEELNKYFTINLNLDTEICAGSSFFWEPRIYPNIEGCTSDLVINLNSDDGMFSSGEIILVYDETIEGYRASPSGGGILIDAPIIPGIYTLQIWVANDCGGKSIINTTIEVLPLSPFQQDHIVCNNEPVSSPLSITSNIYAGQLVESGTDLCVQSPHVLANSSVEFIAEQEVRLFPGFWAASGTDFLAKIGMSDYDCIEKTAGLKDDEQNQDHGQYIKTKAVSANKDNHQLEVNVYPNPTSTQVNVSINVPPNCTYYSINVYNMLGEKIGHEHINHFPTEGINKVSFDLSTQPSGVYLLQIKTYEGYFLNKIIKS